MTTRLAELVYRWRLLLSGIIVLGALGLAPLGNFTDIDNDITAWFSREDPVFQEYERFRREFGGTRSLIVAVKGPAIFSAEGIEFFRTVTRDVERVMTVQRVYSLASANLVQALPANEANGESGGIEVKPLIPRAGEVDPAVVRARALADPLIRGDLISEDGTVAAIVVTFDEDRIDEVRAGVIQEIHRIVDPKLPPGTEAFYNGSLEISETYNRVTIDNTRKFTPPMLGVITIVLYALFRSARRTALTIFAVLVSVFWTLGLYSLMGFTYNVLASMIVPMIVVLAIADDVHIIQHYDHERRASGSAEKAFKSTVAHLFVPLLGASGTTALGMLSLATSSVVAVRAFGIGSAVGVMVDFALSIVLVPTLLTLARPELAPPPQEVHLVEPMRRIARFSSARPGLIAGLGLAVLLIASAGVLRLRVDTNHINFFSPDHPIHRSADVIDRTLSGVYSFEILLEGRPETMASPDLLMRMDRLADELGKLSHVRKVTSLADYVKRINRELNDGSAAADVIPASRETVAQELFVFGLSDDGREELSRIVSSDFSSAHISVKLASMSSDIVFEQIHEAERLAEAAFRGTGVRSTVTGSGRLFSQLDHYLVTSQISSFGTAFLTVFGVIFLVFRSARYGLLAIAPNLFPVFAVLGVMGWLGISLNIATIMVASVALGVVDDDTIHFISRFRREVEAGATADEAIEMATVHEGRASLTTALINVGGFGVLMFSEYKPTMWFGLLLALTLGVAFLAEVFILPATIKLAPGLFGARGLRGRRAVTPPDLAAG